MERFVLSHDGFLAVLRMSANIWSMPHTRFNPSTSTREDAREQRHLDQDLGLGYTILNY